MALLVHYALPPKKVKKVTMAKKVVVFSIKGKLGVAGFMTKQSRFRGILLCLLTGIMLTGISVAQDSAQVESKNNAVFATLLQTRGYGASPITSQAKDMSDQQARTQAILATVLRARTPVRVSLAKPVDARKNKPSAELIATATEEIKSADGEVVIPAGAAIVGLIREVRLRSPEGQDANVELAVDHVLLTDGSKSSLAHALQVIDRSRPTNSNRTERELPIDQQARTVEAMRALATPASMGGGMLRDGISLMDASGDPGQTMRAAQSLTSRNEGVVALPDLYLSAEVSGKTNTPVFNENYTRLRLSKGTEMILRVNEQ